MAVSPQTDAGSMYLNSIISLQINNCSNITKSREDGRLSVDLREIGETAKNTEILTKAVNGSFATLVDDLSSGRINHVRYLDYLKNYRDFFQDIQKSEIPISLNSLPMLDEIERHFDPLPDVRQFVIERQKRLKQAMASIATNNSLKKSMEKKPLQVKPSYVFPAFDKTIQSIMKTGDTIQTMAEEVKRKNSKK